MKFKKCKKNYYYKILNFNLFLKKFRNEIGVKRVNHEMSDC